MKIKLTYTKGTLLLILAILLWVFFNVKVWSRSEEHGGLISYDVTNYYSYLPAYFIHDDLTFRFVDQDSIDYRGESKFFPLAVEGTDKYVVKVTMGMSFLYAPFFGMAHAVASSSDSMEADGFSAVYEFFLGLAGLFYCFIGLVYLRLILLKHFTEIISSLVLLVVLFGTNMFYYATTEPAMSHVFSFALISSLLYYAIQWLNSRKWPYMAAIGLLTGLIILVRPVNILVLIVPVLYGINTWSLFVKRCKLFWDYKIQLGISVIIAFIVLLPQFVFWKLNTGSWIFYSYTEEQMYLLNPHIWDGLFSYRKGWFLYTPVMLIAFLSLCFSFRKSQKWSLGVLVFLILFVYVTFSWWCWWYGGSFGARSMIDVYAFMTLPLGMLFTSISNKRWMTYGGVGVFVLLIALNLIQTQQKRLEIIHWDAMTKEAYWATFLKLDNPKNYQHLYLAPNYEKAVKGEDEY